MLILKNKKGVSLILVAMLFFSIYFAGCAEEALEEEAEALPIMPREPARAESPKREPARVGSPKSRANGYKEFSELSLAAQPGRLVIQTSDIQLEVRDTNKTYKLLLELVSNVEGYIVDSSSWITSSGQREGTMTIRVPASLFGQSMEYIRGLGKVESEEIGGEDVTEEYIDLDSRLRNLKNYEDNLLKILRKANSVDEMLDVEAAISDVREDIERITGRMNYLRTRVEYSTITIEYHEHSPIIPRGQNAPSKAWEGFLSTLNGILIFLGTVGPIIIILVVIFLGYYWYKHYYKQKK
jgi:hypothetical protein